MKVRESGIPDEHLWEGFFHPPPLASLDFIETDIDVAEFGCGYAMLLNILHAEQPLTLVREALRILSPGGTVAVIHWIYEPTTPRGADLAIRPRPEQCRDWLRDAGFHLAKPLLSLPPTITASSGVSPHSLTAPSISSP